MLQDLAVFASTGLTLVRVTDQVLLAWELARHEAPLQTRWEARATTTTQARFFDCGNDFVLRHTGGQDLAQCLVTAACDVVLQRPVAAVQTSQNLWADVTVVETSFHCGRLELGENL